MAPAIGIDQGNRELIAIQKLARDLLSGGSYDGDGRWNGRGTGTAASGRIQHPLEEGKSLVAGSNGCERTVKRMTFCAAARAVKIALAGLGVPGLQVVN